MASVIQPLPLQTHITPEELQKTASLFGLSPEPKESFLAFEGRCFETILSAFKTKSWTIVAEHSFEISKIHSVAALTLFQHSLVHKNNELQTALLDLPYFIRERDFFSTIAIVAKFADTFDHQDPATPKDSKEALSLLPLRNHPLWNKENKEIRSHLLSKVGRYLQFVQRDYPSALSCHQETLELRIKKLGDEHLDVATSFNEVGISLDSLGRHDEALVAKKNALVIRQKALGDEHELVAKSLNNVGTSLGRLSRHKEALVYLEKALVIKRNLFGEDHLSVATAFDNVAESFSGLENYTKALEAKKTALKIRKRILQENHRDIALSYENTAVSSWQVGRIYEAVVYFKAAIEIFCLIDQEPFSRLARVVEKLVKLLNLYPELWEEEGKKAVELLLKNRLGEQHALTLSFKLTLSLKKGF